MSKNNISATVEETTIKKIKDKAKKEKRSFSSMVDILLNKGLEKDK